MVEPRVSTRLFNHFFTRGGLRYDWPGNDGINNKLEKMSMWMRNMFLGFVAAAMAGCSTMPAHMAAQSHEPSIHKVGVISLLGDDARFYRAGPLMLPTQHEFLSVPQWGIDGYTRKVVRESLAQRYQYVPLHYDAKSLEDKMEVSKSERFRLSHVKDKLHQIVDGRVDAVVLVVPTTQEDLISGKSEPLVGYGMYRLTLMSQQIGAPYVGIKVMLLDAKTLKPISQHAESKYMSYYTAGWSTDFKNMPADQRQQLEGNIKDLLAKELKIGLKKVGLVGAERSNSRTTKNATGSSLRVGHPFT